MFISRRQQEKYHTKRKKLYVCFIDLEKALDRVQRKVLECAMRKKGKREVLVRPVMSRCEGEMTRRVSRRESCKKSIMLKERRYMCFVDQEKVFDNVPRKVLAWK